MAKRTRYHSMSRAEFRRVFEARLEALLSRAERMRAIERGEYEVAIVTVREHVRPAVKVASHRRRIIRRIR